MALDKIGLHYLGALVVPAGRARGVKLADCSVQDARDIRAQIGPHALIIWRKVLADQPLDNPEARAQQFVARYQSEMLAVRAAVGPEVAFEGWNEVGPSSAEAFCRFELERLRIMHGMGLRCVVGNFAVGNPPVEQWPVYAPMLQAMHPGDYLGLHDYWAVPDDIDNHWYVGRWRHPAAALIRNVPTVITECGRDKIEDREDHGLWPGSAWKRAGVSIVQYLTEWHKYSALLDASPQVRLATAYQAGNDPRWTDYDVRSFWPMVTSGYANPQSYPSPVPQPQPEPEPPPAPTYGQSSRLGAPITDVIWHGAEGHNIRAYFGTYEARKVRQVSAHYAIERDGRTDTIVPEDMAAWHCGGSTIPGWDGNPNRCTIGIEMACDPAPAAPGWTEAQIQAAIKLGRDISARRGISRIHHHRHSGVDASKRDPREFPWGRLMDAMFPPPPEPEPPEEDEDVDMEKIRNAAWNALDVPLNPDAAFQRYAREHDLGAPLTAELYIWLDPVNYCYQGYMGGIVWASVGDWGNVKHLAW